VDENNRIITPTVGDREWNLDGLDVESEMNKVL
jgi:hypothetical protein